jgi:hypothetical protein
MTNPIKIHINRRFHVPLDSIVKIVKKKHGSIWVYFNDGKSEKPKIAVAKTDIGSLLTIINTYLLMSGKKPMVGIYE